MQILQVELENIKSYERALVTFAPGVNAIVGHNGAGKSTILEAIGFALFDSIAYKATEFLRQNARTGTVAVTFLSSYDERTYRVERRFGGSHLYVVYDTELQSKLCEGKVDVLAFVRRHTAADPSADLSRLFSDAIGVPQGSLTYVFLQPPAARKATFDALLQVDEYKTAFDKLLEPRNMLIERQRTLAQQAAVLSSRLERAPILEEAIRLRRRTLAETQQRLQALGQQLAVVHTRRAELEQLRTQLEELTLRHARLTERIDSLNAQTAEAERLQAEAQQAHATVEANLPGHQLYTETLVQRQALERQAGQRQALVVLQAKLDKAAALAASEQERLDAELLEVGRAEQTVVELAPLVQQQTELELALAAAQHELLRRTELEAAAAAQAAELARLQQRELTLAAQLEKVNETQEALRRTEARVETLRQVATARAQELGVLQAAADELKKQNQLLNEVATSQCPVCEQPLTAEHRSEMLARNELRLQEMRRQYAAAQSAGKLAEAEVKQEGSAEKALQETLRSLPRPAELEELRRRASDAAATLAVTQSTLAQLAQTPQFAEELTARLAVLNNPRQQNALAAQRAAQRRPLEAKLAQAHQQRAEARQQLADIEQQLLAYATVDQQLADTAAILAANEQAYRTVLGYRQHADALESRTAQLARSRQAVRDAASELDQLAATRRTLSPQFDPVEYSRLSSEEQNFRGELGALEERNQLLCQDQARDEAELVSLQMHQGELAKIQSEQTRLADQVSALEAIRSLLRQSGPFITQAVIRQVSVGANQIFGELMQDYSRQLVWNEEYGITLEVDGTSRQFAQLSGGEQMSAALAVRLALVREMSNIDVAFFDEPTANLDDVRREALARQIMNVKGFQQLFVISHDDTFEQATQNLIRVNRHGNSSFIVTTDGQ